MPRRSGADPKTREQRPRPAGGAAARLAGLLAPESGTDALVAEAPVVPVREIFRRFWPDARPFLRWWIAGLVVVAIVPLIDAASVFLFKLLVDDVLVPRDFGPFAWIVAAYVGLSLLGAVVSFADDFLSDWVGERFLLSLRTRVFTHLQGLSLDVFDRRRLGDVLARLTGDVAAIESFVLSGVADLVSHVLRIVFFGGALFLLSWRLALVSLVVAPLFWFSARFFSRLLKRASREKRRRSGSISAIAEESLSNVALVQAYNRQGSEIERYERQSEARFVAGMASTRLKALFGPLIDLIELAGALVVIGFGIYELTQDRLTLGALLAFLTLMTQLYSPIRGLSRLVNTLYSASAGAERVIEILDERPSVADPVKPVALPSPVRGSLVLDGVRFAYPGAAGPAVQDVSFAVEPGETVALVGASGSGKSTLAKLALRFYDVDAGRVALDGVDVRDLRLHDLREHVAVLLQETLVFHGTIRENIVWGRPGATEEEVVAAARAADAHDFVVGLDDGYDTVVGSRGRRLSGGQRQRIAIARAMIRDAPVLILDEPTTGLDIESARRVLDPLRRLMDGRATVVISHDLLTVRDATTILVLDRGRVVERGSHEELLARGGAYARLHAVHGGGAVSLSEAGAP